MTLERLSQEKRDILPLEPSTSKFSKGGGETHTKVRNHLLGDYSTSTTRIRTDGRRQTGSEIEADGQETETVGQEIDGQTNRDERTDRTDRLLPHTIILLFFLLGYACVCPHHQSTKGVGWPGLEDVGSFSQVGAWSFGCCHLPHHHFARLLSTTIIF